MARQDGLQYPDDMATQSKTELLENLRGMVRDMLRLRSEGSAYAKLARAHGYVDGYMRVLIETGVADQKVLLALVADERHKHDGPALGLLAESERDVTDQAQVRPVVAA